MSEPLCGCDHHFQDLENHCNFDSSKCDYKSLFQLAQRLAEFVQRRGSHLNPQCFRGSDDGCHCGLDQLVKDSLAKGLLK